MEAEYEYDLFVIGKFLLSTYSQILPLIFPKPFSSLLKQFCITLT